MGGFKPSSRILAVFESRAIFAPLTETAVAGFKKGGGFEVLLDSTSHTTHNHGWMEKFRACFATNLTVFTFTSSPVLKSFLGQNQKVRG